MSQKGSLTNESSAEINSVYDGATKLAKATASSGQSITVETPAGIKTTITPRDTSFKHKILHLVDNHFGASITGLIIIAIALVGLGGYLRINIPWENILPASCKQISFCKELVYGGE